MEHVITCPCGGVVVKSANGTVKILNKVMVFRDGKAFAVCKNCGEEVPVPVLLDSSKIQPSDRRPKLFLQTQKKPA